MTTVKKHKHTHTHTHTNTYTHTEFVSQFCLLFVCVYPTVSFPVCKSFSPKIFFFISLFLCLCFPHWPFCHFLSIPVSFHTFSFSTVLPVLLSLFLVLYPFATPYLSTSIISIVYKCVWFSLFLSRKVAHTNYVLFILAN